MFCKHEWKILSETVTTSKFECAMGALKDAGVSKCDVPHQMSYADRKHIQVFTCDKCGSLKRYVEAI